MNNMEKGRFVTALSWIYWLHYQLKPVDVAVTEFVWWLTYTGDYMDCTEMVDRMTGNGRWGMN